MFFRWLGLFTRGRVGSSFVPLAQRSGTRGAFTQMSQQYQPPAKERAGKSRQGRAPDPCPDICPGPPAKARPQASGPARPRPPRPRGRRRPLSRLRAVGESAIGRNSFSGTWDTASRQEPRPDGSRDDALSTHKRPQPRGPRPVLKEGASPPLRPGPPASADTCPKPFLGPPVPRVCWPPLPGGWVTRLRVGPPVGGRDAAWQPGGVSETSSSNYKLNYELYREDVPYRAYECQKIPPLINHVPVKIRRTHMGLGVRSSFSPHKASRNSHLSPGEIKLGTGVLHSIRGELSQIKAQVDSLLASLERMDQQRDQPAGTKDSEENRGPGSEGCSCRLTEAQQEHRNQESTEPRGQCAHVEADSSQGSTDAEHAVKNHTSEPAGSQ
ncbi:PREDICTED: uncharacterized protein LOC103590536 [Galeopterus variegatus]|uniref:Uncharacterized protein LOC103590536 n=1 Tax=Galeopterus variegatus TaxID=482537 RepID=A0ABM0QRL4_GALVR|nr:PREDICTED: uncharacterized protein LOC103590536 [Galeopterus variegatus]